MTPQKTTMVAGSLVLLAASAGAATAQAQGQGNNQPSAVTLEAKPSIVVFGSTTALTGRITGKDGGEGVRVSLARDPFPFDSAFLDAGETQTAKNSTFSFTVTPAAATNFRVVAKTSPPVTSALVGVRVRPRVGLRLSTSTPGAGRLVRFSGSVHPAHDGRTASIQKRSATGRWVTVARTTLRDAGDTRSAFSRRVRMNRDGVLRVKIASHDDHLNGFSRTRSIDVRGR